MRDSQTQDNGKRRTTVYITGSVYRKFAKRIKGDNHLGNERGSVSLALEKYMRRVLGLNKD